MILSFFVNSIKSVTIALKEINNFGNFAGPSLNIIYQNKGSINATPRALHKLIRLKWRPCKVLGYIFDEEQISIWTIELVCKIWKSEIHLKVLKFAPFV